MKGAFKRCRCDRVIGAVFNVVSPSRVLFIKPLKLVNDWCNDGMSWSKNNYTLFIAHVRVKVNLFRLVTILLGR